MYVNNILNTILITCCVFSPLTGAFAEDEIGKPGILGDEAELDPEIAKQRKLLELENLEKEVDQLSKMFEEFQKNSILQEQINELKFQNENLEKLNNDNIEQEVKDLRLENSELEKKIDILQTGLDELDLDY